MIDTAQPIAPPATFGIIYTSDVLSTISQPILVPGQNANPSLSSAEGWEGIVTQSNGAVQSVTAGSLSTACLPRGTASLENCVYTSQSEWAPGLSRLTPEGMNTNPCSDAGGPCCGGDCTVPEYTTLLFNNRCPSVCPAAELQMAMQLPGHQGCGPTQPACPAEGSAACGVLGPYSLSTGSKTNRSRCTVGAAKPLCNNMCTILISTANFPLHPDNPDTPQPQPAPRTPSPPPTPATPQPITCITCQHNAALGPCCDPVTHQVCPGGIPCCTCGTRSCQCPDRS